MRKLTLAIAALFAFVMEAGTCTNFIAAKGATVDGSVLFLRLP